MYEAGILTLSASLLGLVVGYLMAWSLSAQRYKFAVAFNAEWDLDDIETRHFEQNITNRACEHICCTCSFSTFHEILLSRALFTQLPAAATLPTGIEKISH